MMIQSQQTEKRQRGRPRKNLTIAEDPMPTTYHMGVIQRQVIQILQQVEENQGLPTSQIIERSVFNDRRIVRRSLNLLIHRKLLKVEERFDENLLRRVKHWSLTEAGLAMRIKSIHQGGAR